ncbi:MAG: restriction endonuclease subunit S [Nitrososphaerales archaeon]
MSGSGESTSEDRTAFYEKLHNLLWNEAGLDPQKALEHMTFFFAYYMMEPNVDKLGLPVECKWSHLAVLLKGELSENEVFTAMQKGGREFFRNSATRPFFSQVDLLTPGDKKPGIVRRLVKAITDFDMNHHDTDSLGDLFEYIYGRGGTTLPDAGQYFTPPDICKLAFNLAYSIKKTVRRADGSLCTFGDFFCGTGGFAAAYVKGVNRVEKELDNKVDWSQDYRSIYCLDQSVRAVTTTLLNLLILTGQPSDNRQIRQHNSFQDNIVVGATAPFSGLQLDYALMNPPYGGDDNEYGFKYSRMETDVTGRKVKRYCVNEEIRSIGVEDNDKASAGLQLNMATLAPEGVCAIVLPQGFFFGVGKKVVDLRKRLIEEYRIWYVVDIASGAFTNTGTKTSLLVFQRGVGPTQEITFMKSDQEKLVTATLEQLRKRKYSLKYKQYLIQEEVVPEGFQMVRLGDTTTITTGKNKTPDDKKGTLYPYYGTSGVTGYTDHYLVDGEYILTARNGTIGNTFLITGKSYPSDHMFIIRASDSYLLRYLYYWLINNKHVLTSLAGVTTIPGITKTDLVEVNVPIPSPERQQEIVDAIDPWMRLSHLEDESIKLIEKAVKAEIKMNLTKANRLPLSEVCDFKRGKSITKKELTGEGYPVIGGGISPMGYHHEHNREAYTILISLVGENSGHISRYITPVWASNNVFSVHAKENVLEDYLYYSLLTIQPNISFLKEGTAQPYLNPSTIEHLTITVPSLEEQAFFQDDFIDIRQRREKFLKYKARADKAIKDMIPQGVIVSEPRSGSSPSVRRDSTSPVQPDSTSPAQPDREAVPSDLTKLTKQQLVDLCKGKGVKCTARHTKNDLIELLTKSGTSPSVQRDSTSSVQHDRESVPADLTKLTKPQLIDMCKGKGVKCTTRHTKNDLIELLTK